MHSGLPVWNVDVAGYGRDKSRGGFGMKFWGEVVNLFMLGAYRYARDRTIPL